MEIVNLVKKEKTILVLLSFFIGFVASFILFFLGIIFISQTFEQGRVNLQTVLFSLLPSIALGLILGLWHYKRNCRCLDLKVMFENGELVIENNKFPLLECEAVVANFVRKNTGVDKPSYSYLLSPFKEKNKITINEDQTRRIKIPSYQPPVIYKEAVDTLNFCACRFVSGHKNLWLAWLGQYVIILFNTASTPSLWPAYRKMVSIAKKMHSAFSEEELEEWLNNLA